MASNGFASTYPHTFERAPPPSLADVRPGRSYVVGMRRCIVGGGAMANWILLLRYVGRRTTATTLLLFPPAHFVALFLVTQPAVPLVPRLRRQVDLGVGSVMVGEGWGQEGVVSAAALLAVATVGQVLGVGMLDLGLACTLQALLPVHVLLASSRFDLTNPSSSVTLSACVAALLPAITATASRPSFIALACGLVGVAAKAAAWCGLARMWRTMPGAASTPFQFLWHAAPIATILTSLVAAGNLAFHTPLNGSLYPPPSLVAFLAISSLLSVVALYCALAALHDAAGGDGLLKLTMAAFPVGLLILVAASIGGVVVPASGPYGAAFALGTVLALWGQRAESQHDAADGFGDKAWLDSPRLRTSPHRRHASTGSSSSSSPPPPGTPRGAPSRRPPFLVYLPFLPILFLLLRSAFPIPAVPTLPLHRLPPYYANRLGLFAHTSDPSSSPPLSPPTLDIVLAYYDSPVADFAAHVAHVRGRGTVRRYRSRVSVYSKGAGGEGRLEALRAVEGVDEVVELPNVGREGGTYLHHILRRFDPPSEEDEAFLGPGRETSHADMTLFMQHRASSPRPHQLVRRALTQAPSADLAWAHVGDGRFDHLDARTGYLHLAPWVKSDCGLDMRINVKFERMRELYSMFREDLCPPTLQLSAWAAQFFVSRQRIVANPRAKYARVKELLEAPEEHWLHTEGASFDWGGEMGPSNPFFGHALERSWPVIFNCTDPGIADRCGNDVYDKAACQCVDW